MNCFLLTILASRNYDEDSGWMQFLVFIIIVGVYAISGFIKKSRQSKTEQLEDDQELEGMLEQPEYQYRQYQPTQQAVEKPVSSQKPVGREVSAEPRQTRSGQKKHGGHVKTLEMQQSTRESSEEQTVAVEKAKQPQAVEALASLDNPDELRKAIVTYEIIGKPVSLRE